MRKNSKDERTHFHAPAICPISNFFKKSRDGARYQTAVFVAIVWEKEVGVSGAGAEDVFVGDSSATFLFHQ